MTITEQVLAQYQNGDFSFTLYKDGTLVRETTVPNPQLAFPSSLDVKITDYCNMGCAYCHESSTKAGKHGNMKALLSTLSPLPAGVELAFGGGNPLSHPDLVDFLTAVKINGWVSNLTVNQGHVPVYQQTLGQLIKLKLIHGLGVSITSNNFKPIEKLRELTNDMVYHLIAGVNPIETIDVLTELGPPKILVLGYKDYGFGIKYRSTEVDENLARWFKYIPKYLGKVHLSFDNLAIEQLKIERLFTDEGWKRFYMGDDGEYTMYVDGVEQTYAPTSRSKGRTSWSEMGLIEYFKGQRNT